MRLRILRVNWLLVLRILIAHFCFNLSKGFGTSKLTFKHQQPPSEANKSVHSPIELKPFRNK